MSETQLADLKQFIATTVSQATADMATKDDIQDVRSEIVQLDRKLSRKIDDLDLKLDTISVVFHKQLTNHETRLTTLESRPA